MLDDSLSRLDGVLGLALNTEAVSGEKFAAGLGLDGIVDRHAAAANQVFGLSA
jgi:hypothetical protein